MYFKKLFAKILLLTLPVISMANINCYTQHNLISDGFVAADHIDTTLINPWGIAFLETRPNWITGNLRGNSTAAQGNGEQGLSITIPPAPSVGGTGSPTGIVANNTSEFLITSELKYAPAAFIFAAEDGTISGWASTINLKSAVIAVDNSAKHSVYKGLAIASDGDNTYLYATDFYNRRVDVFDSRFSPVTRVNAFVDPAIPDTYAPFGIQNINGDIYVTYAKQDAAKHDSVKGPGFGYVNVFDPKGRLINRVASAGPLNAPWGLALAPGSFGRFANSLLVGNSGDGLINSFNLVSKQFLGHLRIQENKPLVIDGLWGIRFGNGFYHQPTNTLFFAAGIGNKLHGLYGRITPMD